MISTPRAVVYHINTDDMTIEQVFEYGKNADQSGILTGSPV